MSTFSDASLVLVPSGIKNQKVYSIKPTDGSGDLTFSRASNATRVNSSGLVEKVRTNLVLQSEAFNTTWSAVGVSVTANTTANPLNGSLTADTITLSAGTAGKNVSQNFSQNGVFTQSVYLKAGTHQFVQLLLGDDVTPRANFDLVNGTASATSSTASIVSVGNGWFRCSMSYTTTIGSVVYLWAVDSLAATRAESTASTGTFFAFGFQLETGDIATDYIATTTTAVSVGPVSGLPRLDYSGGASCPSLLLEPQRTNLNTFSEQLNDVSYTKQDVTISTNAGISPDGTMSADLAFPTTTGSNRLVEKLIGISFIEPQTISYYLKASGINWVALDQVDGGIGAWFNLSLGTIGTISAGVSASIQSAGNGWYRCSIARPSGGGATAFNRIRLVDGNNLTSVTKVGTNGVLIWGVQNEQAAYATSYIPTLSSAVTRVADAASKTGISSLIGQTEGVVFLEVGDVKNNAVTGAEVWYLEVRKDQDNSFGLASAGGATQPIRFVTKIAGTPVTEAEPAPFANSKIAIKYTSTQFKVFLNGVLEVTVNKNIGNYADIEFMEGAGVNLSMILKQFLVFPTALSDAECITLTA